MQDEQLPHGPRGVMRTARTLIAGLLIPGLGFVLADRVRLGVIAATGFFTVIVIFSLSRQVLVPAGYYAMCVIAITVALWAVIHSTWIAYSFEEAAAPETRWAVVAVFVSITLVAAWGTIWNRGTNLGYETFRLPSNSMLSTLAAGDYILVDTWHFSDADPQFGDLVVFGSPDNPGTKYVKRIIGLPGDSIELRDNILYRNGSLTEESYVLLEGGSPRRYRSFERLIIGSDEYFILGDSRDNSRDSRFFGPVPRENIKGRVSHLWYSSRNVFPVVF